MKRLLINWAFYDPAGHVVEALQHAYGYFTANPNVAISLLLNSSSLIELTRGCPWLSEVYPVSLSEVAAHGEQASSLQAVPRSWDYIVHDPRVLPGAFVDGWDEAELMLAQPVIQRYLQAREWQGASPGFEVRWNSPAFLTTDTPLPFKTNAHLRLEIPDHARAFATQFAQDGPIICILPVSTSGLAQSPSPLAWEQVCDSLATAFPGGQMCITGITYMNAEGQRVGFDFGPEDARSIGTRVPGIVECFDIGLWNQLALIERADIFCSPHTGFAFLGAFVGTPWLTISGCPWPEYLFNGVPFYSALPTCPNYPASAPEHRDSSCMRHWFEETQPACMSDTAVVRRIPDIVAGARYLLEQHSFTDACQRHIEKLKAAGYAPHHFPYFAWTDKAK